jgi:hypothetical protein
MRFARRVAGCGLVLTVLLSTSVAPALAQDAAFIPGIVLESYPLPEPAVDAGRLVAQAFTAAPALRSVARPKALMPLYGTLGILQGLDMHSTMKSIGSGNGSEANPIMEPVVKNSAAFLAVKASTTVGVIWMSEKLWRRHRKAAVVSVFVVNAIMAGVVANNYRVK